MYSRNTYVVMSQTVLIDMTLKIICAPFSEHRGNVSVSAMNVKPPYSVRLCTYTIVHSDAETSGGTRRKTQFGLEGDLNDSLSLSMQMDVSIM